MWCLVTRQWAERSGSLRLGSLKGLHPSLMNITITDNNIWDSKVNNLIWLPHTLAIEDSLGEDVHIIRGDFDYVDLEIDNIYSGHRHSYVWQVPKFLRKWLLDFFGDGDPIKADAAPITFRFPGIERMMRYGGRID